MEIGVPPPVPPRRRKRKTDKIIPPKPITKTITSSEEDKGSLHNGSSRPKRKPRSLPPPPLVPRSDIFHGKEVLTSSNNYLSSASTDDVRTSSSKGDSDGVKLQLKPLVQVLPETRTEPRFVVTQVTNIQEDTSIPLKSDPEAESHDDNCSSVELDYRNENRSGRSSPMPRHYSPLFFTMRDFESVMAHSGECDKSFRQQFDTITTPAQESVPNSITSFIDNSYFDDCNDEYNEEQVCFRVTTTNVPFEKCLGDWNVPYDSGEFDSQFENTEDHYIFENYMDHRQNPKFRSTAAFLFDEDTFENLNTVEPTSFHSATKVRFVIESPTLSIVESETPDSISNFDSFISDEEITNKSSVIITEIIEGSENVDSQKTSNESTKPDEFGDIPFSSLFGTELKTDSNCNSHKNIRSDQLLHTEEIASNCNPNNSCESVGNKNINKFPLPRSTPSPRFMSPSKKHPLNPIPDLDEILPVFPPTYDPRDEGFVKKNWDTKDDDLAPEPIDNRSRYLKQTNVTPEVSENSKHAREAFLSGKLRITSYDNLDSSVKCSNSNEVDHTVKSQSIKQKIFIDAALRNFIEDDEDDMVWKDSSDEEDESGGMGSTSQDSKLSNLDDRKELVETAVPKVLNRDTCQEREVSLDKHPRPFKTADHENKERNQEKLVEDHRLDVMRSSRFRYQSNGDDVSSVPVTVRRNSFLENMLVDDDSILSFDASVPCTVIATHPKSMMSESVALPSREVTLKKVDESSTPPGDFDKSSESRFAGMVEQKTKESVEKELKKETGVRILGSQPKIVRTMVSSSPSERIKSTGEAKNDVLSELLCNFSAIKLKSVEPWKREVILGEIDEEAAILMEVADENSSETIKSLEKIKTEDGVDVGTIRGECKVKDTADEKTDLLLKQEEELSMAEAEMSVKLKSPHSKRPSSLEIDTCVSAKTDDHNSRCRSDDKSAAVVITSMENRDANNHPEVLRERRHLDTHRGMEILENRDKIINVDKCAIARTTNNPQIRRNNNDNNAMTPVDLTISNDQKSRDAEVSTITPGSVRSFVELYEIQHDKTSEHSKNNYSLPVAKTRTRTKCFKGLWNNADSESTEQFKQDCNEEIRAEGNVDNMRRHKKVEVSNVQTRDKIKVVEKLESNGSARVKLQSGVSEVNEYLRTNNSTRADQSSGPVPVAAKRRTQESCLKISNELSPRSDVKKTVTFYSDCGGKKTEKKILNDAVFVDVKTIELDGKPKTPKRKAPARPADELEAIENLDCATGSTVMRDRELSQSGSKILRQGQKVNPTPLPRSTVSSFATQVHQVKAEEDKKDCSINSGTEPSIPNSEVPQLRQPYVFYCRV
ncbi:uncharacterized protein [Venturia canescens]|uniref:uncharacterized protein isoform X3 n=1 Tax=Venturia canescens TaxID=32260 RepID=UPI001C9D6183|nr:uncharacterized protein LOC122408170 isoform X3 [Venturia canescens]